MPTPLTITVANISLTATTITEKVTAGETVTPMQPCYKAAADGEYYKAANTSAELAACKGLFLGYATDGGRVEIATKGLIDVGSTLVVGRGYAVYTSGLIVPVDELALGDWGTFLGWATTTVLLDLQINAGGTQRA